ncbi:MAG: SMC family ATPase [Candidatus Altiarchaeota archaeon]
MRLLRLELTNWCTHTSLELDLSGGLQIEGRNGTGKSSVLEALRFAFAETARGYSRRIRNGCRSASVRLTFESEGVTYVVDKALHVEKPSTATMHGSGIQIADNPSNVHQRLESLLSEDVLDKLLYIPQNGLTNILEELSGKDGKLQMDRLFGLDRLEKVWEKAGLEVQEAEMRVMFLGDELKRHPENFEELYQSQKVDCQRQLDELMIGITAFSDKKEAVKGELETWQQRLSSIAQMKSEIDSLNLVRSGLKLEEASHQKELEAVLKRLGQLSTRNEELAVLSDAKLGLTPYERIRQKLIELRAIEDNISNLASLSVKKERLKTISETLKDTKNAEDYRITLTEELKRKDAEYASDSARLRDVADYRRQLTALDGKPSCPTCGQKINAFVMEKQVRESSDKESAIGIRLRQQEPDIRHLAEELKKAEGRTSMLKELEAEARHLTGEISERESQHEGFSFKRHAILAEMCVLGYAGEQIQEVEAKYGELKKLEGRMQALQKEISETGSLQARKSAIEDMIASSSKRLKITEERLGTIGFDESELKLANSERDRLTNMKYEIDSTLKSAQADEKRLKHQMQTLEESYNAFSSLRKRFEEGGRHLALLKGARDIFHRDRGIVRYLREGFMTRLNGMLTYHFKRFNENPRYLDALFDRDYNMVIRTTDGELSASQMSGGELAQIALALRIALIDLMSPMRLLILDEPFGSLDERHRELLGESLNRIAVQGQVILVTHVHVESLQLTNRIDLGGY